jgi:hypothetical protein
MTWIIAGIIYTVIVIAVGAACMLSSRISRTLEHMEDKDNG